LGDVEGDHEATLRWCALASRIEHDGVSRLSTTPSRVAASLPVPYVNSLKALGRDIVASISSRLRVWVDVVGLLMAAAGLVLIVYAFASSGP
jgi:hypothetical protein